MSKKEEQNNELEELVKNLFKQSRQKSGTSAKTRLKLILDKSLHQIALRDLLLFSSHLVFAMISMLSLFAKPFQTKP